MAYNIVQAQSGISSGAGTTVSSASFTPGAGSKLLALVTISHTSGTSGITCTLADTSGGNDTWSLLGSANDVGTLNIDVGKRWYLLEGAAATSTVVQATLSGSVAYARHIVVFEITGLDTSPYLDQAFNGQPNPGTGTDAVLSGTTGTLASQPALALAIATNTNGSSIPAIASTGWTSAWSSTELYQRAEHQRLTSTSAVQAPFTCTADGSLDDHYSTIIVLKESTGGSPYTLTAAAGSFSLSGIAAAPKVGRLVSAAVGSFTLSGIAATLRASQSLRAASDITTASWTSSLGGALYAAIDEATASDADYISSPDNPTTETCEVKFAAGTDPVSSTGHVVTYRLQAIGQTTKFVVALYCGATLIATWTEASLTVAAGVTEYQHTLSSGEADAITDYTDLRLRFTASAP